jgi:6-phosphofructokinase 2
MSGIVTLTVSPCIDKSVVVPELIPDKKLMAGNVVMEPGGGGVNVARAVTKCGGQAIAVYPAGGYTGKYFNDLLEMERVQADFVTTTGFTRENIIVLDQKKNLQYRIGTPAPVMSANTWTQLCDRLYQYKDARILVASGSLPPGLSADTFAELSSIAREMNALLVADASGSALRRLLESGVFLVKPNLGELASLTGASYIKADEVIPAARKIINEYNCQVIVVSMGEAGACLVTKEVAFRATPPSVKRVSTVGAGDSMVAGMVLAMQRDASWKDVLTEGVAAGTAATLNPGTALCKPDDIRLLIPQINVAGF